MSVKVDDEILTAAAEQIRSYGERVDDIFDRYIECMIRLGNEGFRSGTASDNINTFVARLYTLQGDLSGITESAASECTKYIGDLDVADDFVY